jgi:hypothetical protein
MRACTRTYPLDPALQIDNDAYHRMEAEYRAAKEKESRNELKIKQCGPGGEAEHDPHTRDVCCCTALDTYTH